MQAGTFAHFAHGAYFPRGGSVKIGEAFLTNVIENGGKVVISARVKNIIIKDDKATGVQLTTGEKFFANKIISATGVRTTLNNLLPSIYA